MVIIVKPSLPILLSFNGGYVDTAGYIALQGLFTAHVTGNFVTIGSALIFGTSGVIAKLLALPVFCAVIIITRLASFHLPLNRSALQTMLTVKLVLLTLGTYLAIRLGPFVNGDSWPAILTGMTLVSAMAIQNAVHRIHLGTAPPTTLMTGTTTQMMIDIADAIRGLSADAKTATLSRLRHMAAAVLTFALGAAVAALLFSQVGVWCFAVPPIVALAARLSANSTQAVPPPRLAAPSPRPSS
jgi:uncharacterized membrane protein YoaK (UPF0700 family)